MSPDAGTSLQRDPGSFKDPSGSIFYWQGEVYRYLAGDELQRMEALLARPVLRELMASGAVVPTEVADLSPDGEPARAFGTTRFLKHERLGVISYCAEWPAPMLADAALATLSLQETLLAQDLSLKDATPYNIQFRGTQPVFIDLPSIEPMRKDGIWVPLNQFCETFLFPLLLHRHSGVELRVLLTGSPNGISLENTYRRLSFGRKLDPRLLSVVQLPYLLGRMTKPKEVIRGEAAKPSTLVHSKAQSRLVQLGTVRSLAKRIRGLVGTRRRTTWSEYATSHSYDEEAENQKKRLVGGFIEGRKMNSVLDIGCNTGTYSVMAAETGCQVTAIDFDHECIARLYEQAKTSGLNLTPLCVDIAHPTPGLGWANRERMPFLERRRYDCVLALALLHHLLVTCRVPLPNIIELLGSLTNQYLIVEYVDPSDRMFQTLLLNRSESYDDLTYEVFLQAVAGKFRIIEEAQLGAMSRRLVILEKKPAVAAS